MRVDDILIVILLAIRAHLLQVLRKDEGNVLLGRGRARLLLGYLDELKRDEGW